MKLIHKIFILIVLSGLLVKCDKEDVVTSRAYPRLKTLAATNITSEGAIFNAEISFRGDFEVIRYGFVWSERGSPSPTISGNDRVIYAENIQANSFASEITTTLKEGVTYYVRSFIETTDYTVYGGTAEFLSLGSKAPTITSIAPELGTIGDTVAIRGERFSYLNNSNEVFFDDKKALVLSSSDTLVLVLVPEIEEATMEVALDIVGNRATFDGIFTTTTPVIKDFFPKEANVNDTLTIVGENFSYDIKHNLLKIGGVKSRVIAAIKNELKIIIPDGLVVNNIVELTIANQKTSFNELFKFSGAVIIDLSATNVTFGEEVKLIGENFSPILENNMVRLGGEIAELVAASKKEITFKVPASLSEVENQLTYILAERELTYSETIRINPPVIQSVEDLITSNYIDHELEIIGENFNPIKEKNIVLLSNTKVDVISATNQRLIIRFPKQIIIPKQNVSFFDSLDVQVTVLDQSSLLEGSMIVNYKSIWTKLSDFPGSPRVFGASFSIGSKGYIGLGNGEKTDQWHNDFWEYNSDNNSWKQLDDFPGTGRSNFALFIIGKKAYIIGGLDGDPSELDSDLNEVWEFDTEISSWTRKNDFPGGPSWNAFGFSINGFGYIGGGLYNKPTQFGVGRTFTRHFWKYDPGSDSWEQLNDLTPELWEKPMLADIFAISDSKSGYIFTKTWPNNSFWKYQELNDTWSKILEVERGSVDDNSGFLLDSKLYVEATPYFYELEPITKGLKIIPLEELEYRRAMSSFTIGDYGYFLLGRTGSTFVRKKDMWKFDPSKVK